MIRFRPQCKSISLSIKEEEVYEAVDEMIASLHERLQRIASCFGAEEPIRLDEIVVGSEITSDPITGLVNVRTVSIRRLIDHTYDEPMIIGFCGE